MQIKDHSYEKTSHPLSFDIIFAILQMAVVEMYVFFYFLPCPCLLVVPHNYNFEPFIGVYKISPDARVCGLADQCWVHKQTVVGSSPVTANVLCLRVRYFTIFTPLDPGV